MPSDNTYNMGGSDFVSPSHQNKTNEFIVCSWNPTGSGNAKMCWFAKYCEGINAKLIMIQEHFKISSKASGLFRKIFTQHNILFKKAEHNEGELRGRGKGGLLQMSCKDTELSLSPINTTSFRIQVQKLRMNNRSILWVNVYFPTDGGDTDELLALLAELELIIVSKGLNSVMVRGDLNYEAARTTDHATIIKAWLIKMELYSVWD